MVATRPELHDALSFLKQVKTEMPAEYETFLEVLTQFRSQNVNAEMVVTVVAEMLVGLQHLLDGFSTFLPHACRDMLLEKYNEGAPLSRRSADGLSPAGSTRKADEASPRGGSISHSQAPQQGSCRPTASGSSAEQQLPADPPPERKRKRESAADRPRRAAAAPPQGALLSSYTGMGKRMNQQQIYQAQLKKSLAPPDVGGVMAALEQRIEALIAAIQQDPDNWIPVVDVKDILHDTVDAHTIARLKKTGVIKIRGTLARADAARLNVAMEQEMRTCLGVDPSNPATYEMPQHAAADGAEGAGRCSRSKRS